MEKRYQVFVSSTYQDLQEERQEVMHALLELDCIPSGMELFPAANENQWSLIKKVIDDCDYYVLILAGRYGSLGPTEKSYTEMEYEYAISKGKPTIAFLHKNLSAIPVGKSEASEEGKEKLILFRESAQKKMCKFWSNPSELGSVVSRSLIQLIKTTSAIGWVRADELPDKDATLELLRLRKHVDELQNELQKVRTTAPKGTETLAQGDVLHGVKYTFKTSDAVGFSNQDWSGKSAISWNDLFSSVAPIMINEASEEALNAAIDTGVWENQKDFFQTNEKTKGLRIFAFHIEKSDFQTVKVQFRALGLITRSEKSRSVKDTSTYWTLTPYGDELMTRLRAIQGYEKPAEEPKVSKQIKKT